MREPLGEPRIHSHITDELPDDHPLAFVAVECKRCNVLVHIGNECMQTWVETGQGAYCLTCFAVLCDNGVTGEEYGLAEGVDNQA